MRIVIDMQGAQSTGSWNRGIGRYTLALAQGLACNSKGHEIILCLNAAFLDSIDRIRTAFVDLLPKDNIKIWYPCAPVAHLDFENATRRRTSEIVREAFLSSLAPDVLLVSSLFEGLEDDAVTMVSLNETRFLTAVILYDLIPLLHPTPYLENPVVKDWYLEKIDYLKRAHLWLAISESSRNEGIQHLGLSSAQCTNISTDADEQFRKLELSASDLKLIKQKYAIKSSFVMYTGGIDFRKNIEGLIRAYSRLPEKIRAVHQLAIVCSIQEDSRHQLLALAKEHGLGEGELILTGFVPEEDLVKLYNCCSLFVFPSWHEGFGLPALEAMRCGASVIASKLSSLPEVVGMDEALFNPYSDESIASLMERALVDEVFRKRLQANAKRQSEQFSWGATAERAIVAMEQAHAIKSAQKLAASKKMPKLKLAFVSPLPPERSGISDYCAELLPVLAEYYQIEVIVQQGHISDAWMNKYCSVRTVEWFMANAHSYSRVLYHFGNSSFHQHMFAMLKAVPGVVVLHDFYLSGVLHYMQATGYAPNFFSCALYNSHGYRVLKDMANAEDISDVISAYPASRAIFENSVGTIVHSANSVRLAKKWYDIGDSALRVIPHLRKPAEMVWAADARKTFGFAENDFVVCSFGLLGPSKLNHTLLQAWLRSSLAQDQSCHLVFVGENHAGLYGAELVSSIKKSSCAARIRITGWASEKTFKSYLTVANIGVQLRTLSRGETSGTVLDCMNHSLPTIVNANGSMADLDKSTVWMLPDEFDDTELIQALEVLRHDAAKRKTLSDNARSAILHRHDPDWCAKAYVQTIEDFYKDNSHALFDLYPKIAPIFTGAINDVDLLKLSQKLALNFPLKNRAMQLLVDVSELVQRDAKSGIQRVVRNILKEWLINPPEGYRVEPIYATLDQGYRYARRFTAEFLALPSAGLADEPIDFATGDIFFGLDLQPHVQVAQRGFYQFLRRQGVKVFFAVYDLLPTLMPQYFGQGASENHTQWLEVVSAADGAFCISKAVADELNLWQKNSHSDRLRSYKTGWFHLGADIDNSQPSQGLPQNAKVVLAQLTARPSFLMVGTLEPRKGHLQILNAFEQLWEDKADVNLIVADKQGWMMDELVQRLGNHPEYNKRLFWLKGIGDEYLEKVYAASTCLIAGSYGEGFGLPLIEAAQHKLPIIARDIPVFREVAGEYAYYFHAKSTQEMAEAVKLWLKLYQSDLHPKSDDMPWLTWNESARNLLKALKI